MAHAKDGQFWNINPQRFYSNNSIAYTEKPTDAEFMEDWLVLVQSGSGERGIFNRESANYIVERTGRRKVVDGFGCNPCQPKDALVYEKTKGLITFNELNINDIIWSKEGWTTVVNKWSTGFKQTYKYKTTSGTFYGTENHRIVQKGKKIEVKDAKTIDSISITEPISSYRNPKLVIDGLVLGDGSVHKASNNKVYLCIGNNDTDYFDSEIKHLIINKNNISNDYSYDINTDITYNELPATHNRSIPKRYFTMSREDICSLLKGLYSANGSIVKDRISYKTTSKQMVEDIQLMLSLVGIVSYYTTNKKKKTEFSNGEYECRESYDICITSDRDIFKNNIGFIQKYKMDKLNSITTKSTKTYSTYSIKEVIDMGVQEVFDITVNNPSHTYWTNNVDVSNCSEIILRDSECCNLSEVIVRENDTLQELRDKVKKATFIGCVQATLDKYDFISDEWKKNIDEERLLGVSLTGLRDHNILSKVSDTSRVWLADLKSVAIQSAVEYSKVLNINMPAAITCCKPSGTVSQLVNSSSGLHPRFSKFYIRRVRISSTDPLCKMLQDKGFKWNPEVGENIEHYSTAVFDFPIKSPDTSIMIDDTSAIEQLNYWKMIQKYWCEHKPSCTIYVKDNEWMEVGAWVIKNWKWVSGISFLPHTNNVYQLAPYETIDEDTYNKLLKELPKIDFSELPKWEIVDSTNGSREFACAGGKCEL